MQKGKKGSHSEHIRQWVHPTISLNYIFRTNVFSTIGIK